MKLIKTQNLKLSDDTQLPLITSICYYNAAHFVKHLRWRVQEDAQYLKPLVESMLKKDSLSLDDVQVLLFYENLFAEIYYPWNLDKNSEQTEIAKEAYNRSQKDLMSVRDKYSNPKSIPESDENFSFPKRYP